MEFLGYMGLTAAQRKAQRQQAQATRRATAATTRYNRQQDQRQKKAVAAASRALTRQKRVDARGLKKDQRLTPVPAAAEELTIMEVGEIPEETVAGPAEAAAAESGGFIPETGVSALGYMGAKRVAFCRPKDPISYFGMVKDYRKACNKLRRDKALKALKFKFDRKTCTCKDMYGRTWPFQTGWLGQPVPGQAQVPYPTPYPPVAACDLATGTVSVQALEGQLQQYGFTAGQLVQQQQVFNGCVQTAVAQQALQQAQAAYQQRLLQQQQQYQQSLTYQQPQPYYQGQYIQAQYGSPFPQTYSTSQYGSPFMPGAAGAGGGSGPMFSEEAELAAQAGGDGDIGLPADAVLFQGGGMPTPAPAQTGASVFMPVEDVIGGELVVADDVAMTPTETQAPTAAPEQMISPNPVTPVMVGDQGGGYALDSDYDGLSGLGEVSVPGVLLGLGLLWFFSRKK